DFTATSGTLLFLPGQKALPVVVPIKTNALVQGNRQFFVDLGTPSVGTTVARGRGTGLIIEDDGYSTLSVGDVTVPKGTAGSNGAVFDVFLPVANNQTVTVNYNTVDGTASAAA